MKPATEMQLAGTATPVVHSDIMRKLMAMVERVARHDAAVLIVGETGVGKEMVARAIHQNSLRVGRAFVDVNCAALPEHLVESELFGYEKGAFSGADSTKPGLFELANEGTLFLDEVGELDAKVQAKLLRVLDGVPYYRLGGSRKVAVDVRLIAATNRDLEEGVREGKFRRDLFHRLCQFQLQVPSLRERKDDVLPIAEVFLSQHAPAAKFSEDAVKALLRYNWPGNVRELKNVVFKAAMQAKSGAKEIRATDLPAGICGSFEGSISTMFEGNLEDMEKQMIFQALSRNGGNQVKAAQQLGVSGRTLRRKLTKYRQEQEQAGGGPGLGLMSAHQQRYFRVSIDLPIKLGLEGQNLEARTVNISSGGLAVQCAVAISHGAAVEIEFNLPGITSPIEAKARLAWSGPDGLCGLSIEEMHPVPQRELQQWLLERARSEGWIETSAGA
jgi:transcriptional regulator with GAF, ATPase, and Fis domain